MKRFVAVVLGIGIFCVALLHAGNMQGGVAADTRSVTRQAGDCVIPDSGPWPPCATGNTPQEEPTDSGNAGDADCVIPESGPWPPCATSGEQPTPQEPAAADAGACVVPESGPWPPCASGGEVPLPVQTHRIGKGDLKAMFLAIFNEDLGMGEGDSAEVYRWQADTSIDISNGMMRLSSVNRLENGDTVYHDFGATFGAADRLPTVNTQWLEISSRQIGGSDLEEVAGWIDFLFSLRLHDALNFEEVTSVYFEGEDLIVTYR